MDPTADLLGRFHSPKAPLRQARDPVDAAPPQELERLWSACLPPVSEDDSPYCQARARLDRETSPRAWHASAQAAEQQASEQWRFQGREVLINDLLAA